MPKFIQVCEDCGELIDRCICEELEDDICDGNCENCELNDEEEDEFQIIETFVNRVLKTNGCPECIFDALHELAETFKEIGFSACKDMIQDCLDDID
jgi:hypothetical protein